MSVAQPFGTRLYQNINRFTATAADASMKLLKTCRAQSKKVAEIIQKCAGSPEPDEESYATWSKAGDDFTANIRDLKSKISSMKAFLARMPSAK